MNNNDKYLTSKDIRELFKIAQSTLYKWRKSGKIKFIKVGYKKILYNKTDIEKLLNEKEFESLQRLNVLYCRVSNTKQKNDLETQKQILTNYCNSQGFLVDKIFSEIASGMNENRKEFNELIKLVLEGKVARIFITYKDRFIRFGFEYFYNLCKYFNTEIIILENQINEENFQKELTEDLISIIHHFSMKMYSNRRNKLKDIEKSLNTMEKNNEKED